MNDMYSWCAIIYNNGTVDYRTHNFKPYVTMFRRKHIYKCECGLKISEEDYKEYLAYEQGREKAYSAFLRHLGDKT